MARRPRPIVPFQRTPQDLVLPKQPQLLVPQQPVAYNAPGVDIRDKFDDFMEGYGWMVLIQRVNLKIHCSTCWNAQYGEGDPQCPQCLGRGYLSVFERHLGRKWSSDNEHRLQVMGQSAPGPELVDDEFWYFHWASNIQVEDVIYEVTWEDSAQTLPHHLLTAYGVTYTTPMRGAGGRIEYWRASAKARPVDRDLVGAHLRRLASQTETFPEDGVLRYVATYQS